MEQTTAVTVRPVMAADEAIWRAMWVDYCTFYGQSLAESVTTSVWARILQNDCPIFALIAEDTTGAALGFANYVLHPHTWSEKTCCYLEDLYVRPEARGHSVGHILIERLITIGKEHDWNRVYWHTETGNTTARRLYDRFRPADDFVRYTVSLSQPTE